MVESSNAFALALSRKGFYQCKRYRPRHASTMRLLVMSDGFGDA